MSSIIVSLIALILLDVAALALGVVSFRQDKPDAGYMGLMAACFLPLLFVLSEGSPLHGVLPSEIEDVVEGVCLVLLFLVVGHMLFSLRLRRRR